MRKDKPMTQADFSAACGVFIAVTCVAILGVVLVMT